jgi:hypothetical protein
MTTYFGPSVLLDSKENGNRWYILHLPRYSIIWTPKDMDAVIGGKEKFYLLTNGVFKGNRPHYPKFGKGDILNLER